jgi:hypothetical protein
MLPVAALGMAVITGTAMRDFINHARERLILRATGTGAGQFPVTGVSLARIHAGRFRAGLTVTKN